MLAFISYQHDERHVGGEVQKLLNEFGIDAFLAHEDIEISYEWQKKILEALERMDLFVALLSENYLRSAYCMQESGIAVLHNATMIPLSLDGTKSPGFMNYIQSRKIEAGRLNISILMPGIVQHDFDAAWELMIHKLRGSRSWRGAEENFELLAPYIRRAKDAQVVKILEAARYNSEVANAARIANEYLPGLLKGYGHHLDEQDRSYLETIVAMYR